MVSCFNLNILILVRVEIFPLVNYSVSCLFLAFACCAPHSVKEEKTKVLRWCKLWHQNDYFTS